MHETDRWATFDCYGTLIDWNAGIAKTLQTLWSDIPTDLLLSRYHAIEPLVESHGGLPYREVLARCLRAIAAIEGLPLASDQEYALAASLPSWPPFPEVPASLRTLRDRGWKLAILSNIDPDLLAPSLDLIGAPIDLTITAADAGSYKPAPGHWDRFFERSGAEPASYVHVAASLFHDIAPMAVREISAVWINRLGERSDVPRVAELPDLRRLAEVLEGMLPRRG